MFAPQLTASLRARAAIRPRQGPGCGAARGSTVIDNLARAVHTAFQMKRGASLLVLFVLGAALLPSACANNVGDEECTPGADPDDKGDGCPYGDPGGPKIHEAACVTKLAPKGATECKTLTWATVYADLVATAPAGAGCADDGCHGQQNAGGIHLDKKDPTKALITLATYKGAQTTPYINTDKPELSWIRCSVEGTEGGGVPMPPAGMSKALSSEVATWVACKLPGAN